MKGTPDSFFARLFAQVSAVEARKKLHFSPSAILINFKIDSVLLPSDASRRSLRFVDNDDGILFSLPS
jgi:hypothetical protein